MGLRGEMHHTVYLIDFQDVRHEIERTDAPPDKGVATRIADFRQHVCFGCAVVHGVDVDDVAVGIIVEIVVDEMGPDESASASDKKTFFEFGHSGIQRSSRDVYMF
jgi:hypothetical protein